MSVTGGFGRLLCARSRRGTPCLLVSAHVFGDQVESVLGALVRPPPSVCARRVSLSRRLSRPYRRAALVMALMLRLISRVGGAPCGLLFKGLRGRPRTPRTSVQSYG